MLSDETENSIRDYIAKKYPRESFGKISEIIETAIKEYLKNHP
jgi:hypothetical protein